MRDVRILDGDCNPLDVQHIEVPRNGQTLSVHGQDRTVAGVYTDDFTAWACTEVRDGDERKS